VSLAVRTNSTGTTAWTMHASPPPTIRTPKARSRREMLTIALADIARVVQEQAVEHLCLHAGR
jgi:hypothetical protein